MLDIKEIRENRQEVEKQLKKKSFNDYDLDAVLRSHDDLLKLIREVDDLRAEKNAAAADRDVAKGKEIKVKLEKLEAALTQEEGRFRDLYYKIPNPPLPDVPEGGEADFVVLREVGEKPKFDFKIADHLEIGEKLDIIDIPRAAKVSGSRFAYLKGDGALLEVAIIQFALQKLSEKGFTPIFPPAMIRKSITEELGYWQGGGNDNYYLVTDFVNNDQGNQEANPLYLVGTGEHSVVPMHANEIFRNEDLPKKYAAFSPCFRRESGSYGKDTRGILRVHQFDKIELIAFTTPEEDEKIRGEMLALVEAMMKELELPYQVVKLAAADLGFPSAETIDINTWMPSQEKYRETHSISTTTHFQSKRLNIKYERSSPSREGQKSGSSKDFVHILNGTAFALGRIIITILENYQQEDGSVKVPTVLRGYLRKDIISR